MSPSLMTINKRCWKVIYSKPRWEKKVDVLLKQNGIECYCPLVRSERKWVDRRKVVEMPLFNSYLFVRVNHKEENLVRQTNGVVNFVYFLGKPAVVRDSEIIDMKHYLNFYQEVETINIREISVGDRARIKEGVFNNHIGEVIQINGKNILMLLENLECALVTKVQINNMVLVANGKC